MTGPGEISRAELHTTAQPLTGGKMLAKFQSSLEKGGDFPVSAVIVSQLRELASDPNVSIREITDLILMEPSLGIRLIDHVNSHIYGSAAPVATTRQALSQIGIKSFLELCYEFILLQKFIPSGIRKGAFASALKKSICTSLLAHSFLSELEGGSVHKEQIILAARLYEMGYLLLAFYYPQVFEAAIHRAQIKEIHAAKSLKEITGLSVQELNQAAAVSLQIPPVYKEILAARGDDTTADSPEEHSRTGLFLRILGAAGEISHCIVFQKTKAALDPLLDFTARSLDINPERLNNMIGNLPGRFQKHCSAIRANLSPLPFFLTGYSQSNSNGTTENSPYLFSTFARHVEEMQNALESGEPASSIITGVMETITWALEFDRVVLLTLSEDKKCLRGKMALGNVKVPVKEIVLVIHGGRGSRTPELTAFTESRPVFFGKPLLENAGQFAAVPVGYGNRAIGVIYADRELSGSSKHRALDDRERAAIGVLSELLDQAVGRQVCG